MRKHIPSPGWAKRVGDAGSTMIEVIVSVLLLVLFTTATTVAVSAGTNTSSDNRARVGASALAQRELEYISREITQGIGAGLLRAQGEVANPHVSAELAAPGVMPGDASTVQYGFTLDGEMYRVVRQVDRWAASAGSACESSTINDNTTIYGTIATVTVTWEGMGASTKPHTASQIFPPKRNETLALDPGQALLVVEVQGAADAAGNTLKEGVRVELSGTGGDPIAKVTNAKGCVAFEVTPTAGGANDYVATLLGDGSNNWITPGGEKQPTVEFLDVKAGDSYVQTAPPYERAARLEVSVTGSVDSVSAVHLRPKSGDLTAAHQEPLDEGTNKAIFTDVYPGEYEVYAGTSPLVDVTLAAGEFKQANVEVPL